MGEKTDFSPKMAFCLQGFRLCGGDQRAMKTGEVCDHPLETFGAATFGVSCLLVDNAA
jgi:hypothetical protein